MNMLEKLIERIKNELNVSGEITPTTALKEDLGADSLDIFEFVMALEEEYNIEIPSEDLVSIKTVQDMVDYLKSKGIEE